MTNPNDRFSVLEEHLAAIHEDTAETKHLLQQLQPGEVVEPPKPWLLVSSDPVVIAAQKDIAAMEAKNDWSGIGTAEKYKRLKLLVSQDLLSRCVFEYEGERYQLTSPAINLKGRRYTAPEIMEDKRILAYLVETGSSVKPII